MIFRKYCEAEMRGAWRVFLQAFFIDRNFVEELDGRDEFPALAESAKRAQSEVFEPGGTTIILLTYWVNPM